MIRRRALAKPERPTQRGSKAWRSPRCSWIPLVLCSLLVATAGAAEPAAQATVSKTDASPDPAHPRLGLVLSGGGARGLAHIGVLKVLEREHIPVDVISGTSMGAIIGGLYASGLSATELEKQLLAISWDEVFASRVDRQQLSERRKEEDFEFSPVLEFGLRDGELRAPQGTLSSRGLEVLLRRLTLPVRSVGNFDQLPTPFRAVATDMESGGEIVIGDGDLALALRSSMSVPGVFAPIEWKGRVLGDGGLVDNLPVDVARDMGAEQVIAVNVGTPPGGREALQSLVGLTGQMITLLIEQNVQRSLASLWKQDLLITPNLGKLTAADFARAPDFIAQGEAAAEAMLPRLRPLALSPQAYAEWQAARIRRSPAAATLAAVKFEGAEISHPERFASRLESKPGQTFDAARAERDARELASSGDYARVDYSVEPQADGGDALVFALDEKPWGPNYFSAGLDLSTDFSGQSAFNLRLSHNRHWLTPGGAEWRNQLSIGQTPRLYSELYDPVGASGSFFISGWGEIERRQFTLYDEDSGEQEALLSRLMGRLGLDLGAPFGRFGELRLGLVHERWRLTPKLLDSTDLPSDDVNGTWNETGLRLRAVVDQLDYAAFPQHGYRLQVESTVGRVSGGGISGSQPLSRIELQATDVASVGPSTLNLNLRLLQANQPADSTAGQYTLGGFQQLSGYQAGQLSGRALAFGRATYYLRLGDQPVLSRGLFVGGSLEAGNTWDSRQEVRLTDLRYASSAFIGADTGIGPLYLAVGYAPRGGTVFYIFIGRP